MFLDKNQSRILLNEDGVYECSLLTQQFAYKFYENNVSPVGNVISFSAPAKIGPVSMEQALIVAGELQNMNAFGTIAFQRLYATQLGSLLANWTEKDYYVQEGCLYCEDKQVSLTVANKVKDSGLFHLVFPLVMYQSYQNVHPIELEEYLDNFVGEITNSFNYLVNSIFIGSCRDNF